MKSQAIASEIGFADSEIESYRKDSDVLEVIVKAWNEKRLRIRFGAVVRMLDNDAGYIEELCEICEETDFFRAAIQHVYEDVPSEIPYRHFQFVSVEGVGALDVVAETVSVSTE